MGIVKGGIKENKGIHGESFSLPEEMKVVTPMTERKEPDFDADPFLQVDKWAPETPEETPTDLAHQHDHYLYGVEKKIVSEKTRQRLEFD
jgi:hypothetical protein